MSEQLNKDEFCRRFIAHMVKMAPFQRFKNDDGEDAETVMDYAEFIAPTYWECPDQRYEGPEECAEADIGSWGEA